MLNLSIDWTKQVAILTDTEKPEHKLVYEIYIGQLFFKGSNIMFKLRDDMTAKVIIKAVDAMGFDAPIETVTYASSNEAIITVSTDGVITPKGLGDATVHVVANAATLALTGDLTITIVGGQAVALAVSADIVTATPAPAPAPATPPVTPAAIPPVV